MMKLKRTAQDQEAVIKNTSTYVVKKQRKKNNKKLLNGIHKNDSEKSSESNEIAKNILTSKQKNKKKKKHSENKSNIKDTKGSDVNDVTIKIDTDSKMKHKIKNKFDMNNMKRSSFLTTYPKDDKKTSEVFQELLINTNKSEIKKKSNKRKQKMNLDHANKNAARVDNVTERNKKLQKFTKNSINFEHKMGKIEKFKKMTEKKMKRMSAQADTQHIKTDEMLKLNKYMKKIKKIKEQLEEMLDREQTSKDRVITQLKAIRFKFINEILCNTDSLQSKHYFKQNPDAFEAYQIGYKWQLEQWGMNPLDVIISSIIKLPTDNVIADFGCGEARLAASVPHMVHSFDFIALNDRVKACDMASTPLRTNSVHVVVFCLSLMGSNLNDYIIEANRVLKDNGILKIAEVESRFEDVKDFIRLLRNYGFKNTMKDLIDLFYFMDFKKVKDISMKRKTRPPIMLKCLYKKS